MKKGLGRVVRYGGSGAGVGAASSFALGAKGGWIACCNFCRCSRFTCIRGRWGARRTGVSGYSFSF